MSESRMWFRFESPEDIHIGRGRIVYDPVYRAWVLPGGIRTLSKQIAEDMARTIDVITRRQEEKSHGH